MCLKLAFIPSPTDTCMAIFFTNLFMRDHHNLWRYGTDLVEAMGCRNLKIYKKLGAKNNAVADIFSNIPNRHRMN